MSAADTLLAQCKRVRSTGNGTWVACCPAHEDKNPSMTVRELPDGMVLVHCFAGCSIESITGACGLAIGDLFPEKTPQFGFNQRKPLRQRFPAADVLLMVGREMDIVQVVADDIAAGRTPPQADIERVRKSRDRIREAMKLAGVEEPLWRPK